MELESSEIHTAVPRGLLVVRKSEASSSHSRIGETYYCGIDRMRWADIDRAFYSNELPEVLSNVRARIWDASPAHLDFKVCFDVSEAVSLLEYSNRQEAVNEIVAIDSILLAQWNPDLQVPGISVEWLGVDPYTHGYGSQLLNGLFSKPTFFQGFLAGINRFGLFDIGNSGVDQYATEYFRLAAKANLDPIPDLEDLDLVTVGRVILP